MSSLYDYFILTGPKQLSILVLHWLALIWLGLLRKTIRSSCGHRFTLQVPFPNLLQKTSWFLEGRPPPVLDYQDDDGDDQEVTTFDHCDLQS